MDQATPTTDPAEDVVNFMEVPSSLDANADTLLSQTGEMPIAPPANIGSADTDLKEAMTEHILSIQSSKATYNVSQISYTKFFV